MTDDKDSLGRIYDPIRLNADNVHGKHAIIDRNKGVQGHYNSCYLDSTIFSMFAFNKTFDFLLLNPLLENYPKIHKALFDIVESLRKNYFVEAKTVMKFRKCLDKAKLGTGLTEDEKDPEEFLSLLLDKIFKVAPPLEFTSNESSFIFQIFVEGNAEIKLPTVQYLFEESLKTSNIKLKKLPENLVLLMPRFGKAFKVYENIFPSIQLDMSEIIEDARRHCFSCGEGKVTFECLECFKKEVDMCHRLFAYCKECENLCHKHPQRTHHKPIEVPPHPRDYPLMELYAVLCIETSHYVSFTRGGEGPAAEWCFFDSMADREGDDVDGINIPEVSIPDDLNLRHWLTEQGYEEMTQGANAISADVPRLLRRMLKDVYMCLYRPSKQYAYEPLHPDKKLEFKPN